MTKMSGSPPRPDLANVMDFPSGEKEYERTVVPALKLVSGRRPLPSGRTT
jgi:hypothetical protein